MNDTVNGMISSAPRFQAALRLMSDGICRLHGSRVLSVCAMCVSQKFII